MPVFFDSRGGGPTMTGRSRRKGRVAQDGTSAHIVFVSGASTPIIAAGGGWASSMSSVARALKTRRLLLERSTPIRVTVIRSIEMDGRDLNPKRDLPSSMTILTSPSTVAPPTKREEDRCILRTIRGWLSFGKSTISVSTSEGTNVLEGGLRNALNAGRRIGDCDLPREGMGSPVVGGSGGASDSMDPFSFGGEQFCEDLLVGMVVLVLPSDVCGYLRGGRSIAHQL